MGLLALPGGPCSLGVKNATGAMGGRETRTGTSRSAERLTVSRENVVRSQEDLRLAQEKFRVGAGTILDTITAESDLTLTRANEVTAIVDYLIGRANLARATGNSITRQ